MTHRKKSIVRFSFHTLLLYRDKSSGIYVADSLKLCAQLFGTQLLRATRKSFEGLKRFPYLFFKWSREEDPDPYKFVIAKAIRIDRTFIFNMVLH